MPSKASKLLEKMRNSQKNWKRKDIISLYKGYGFEIKSGRGGHDKIYHPEFPQIYAFLPRHHKLSPAYVQTAVENVDKLEQLKK